MAVAQKIICRPIGEDDLDAVADVLTKGFSERSRAYWLNGLARLRERPLAPDSPRYGLMLDLGGKPVGVMLMLFWPEGVPGIDGRRCNLSSWYVEPAYGGHAGTLVLNSLRRKGITYTNISAAQHTRATVEAVKFLPYTTGYVIAMPALARNLRGTRVYAISGAADLAAFPDLPERKLLLDHVAMGCLCLVVERDGAFHPFVFLRFQIRAGRVPLPMQQLIFCRHIDEFVRFAAPIGRFLLKRGMPFVIFDTDAEGPGPLPGVFRRHRIPKYYRGLDRPRLGDLAYSERVVFGP